MPLSFLPGLLVISIFIVSAPPPPPPLFTASSLVCACFLLKLSLTLFCFMRWKSQGSEVCWPFTLLFLMLHMPNSTPKPLSHYNTFSKAEKSLFTSTSLVNVLTFYHIICISQLTLRTPLKFLLGGGSCWFFGSVSKLLIGWLCRLSCCFGSFLQMDFESDVARGEILLWHSCSSGGRIRGAALADHTCVNA